MTELTAADLSAEIEHAWERLEVVSPATHGPVRTAVEEVIRLLDAGAIRVAEKENGAWVVRQRLKQAILLWFRLNASTVMRAGALGGQFGPWWDKIPGKFEGWDEREFEAAGFRAVPGAIVRRGAFIGRNAILMPCFVNIGARVGEGTMIDTWATVGSGAQIGANVHVSGGAGIGGVLEPLQAAPTIIEDGCFIGARCETSPAR